MAFDPSKPVNGVLIDADFLRGQFNSLKDLIDAIPGITSAVVDSVTTLNPGESATVTLTLIGTVLHMSLALPRGNDGTPGQPGQTGQQGPPFANALIDSTTTLDPGSNASVSVFFDGSNVHFSFGIPRGGQGEQGIQGIQGPPIANAVVDSVTTLNPGESATVSVSFDGTTAHFSFGIPRGAQGDQGIQGPMGEVSNAAMSSAISSAIAGTSNTTNGVALLNLTVSDPPTQIEMQTIANKIDELIGALRR